MRKINQTKTWGQTKTRGNLWLAQLPVGEVTAVLMTCGGTFASIKSQPIRAPPKNPLFDEHARFLEASSIRPSRSRNWVSNDTVMKLFNRKNDAGQ